MVLEWPAGTIVAVDGEPGSGKSRLLAKILDQVPKADVAFVPQRNWFFRGTLVSNIALGAKVRASRLQKVVEMAGLNECLSRLPLGVQTTIDEFGRPLSHCEQRQVCLARAFYQSAWLDIEFAFSCFLVSPYFLSLATSQAIACLLDIELRGPSLHGTRIAGRLKCE